MSTCSARDWVNKVQGKWQRLKSKVWQRWATPSQTRGQGWRTDLGDECLDGGYLDIGPLLVE